MKALSKSVRHWIRGHVALLALVALAVIVASNSASQVNAQGSATLEVNAPANVKVGQAIKIRLVVRNAKDLTGYEFNVLFDTSAAEFSGLQQRKNDMPRFGRQTSPLIAQEPERGVAIGFYSCPFASCREGRSAKTTRAATGTVKLADLSLIAKKAGTLEIRLDAAKFVGPDGTPIDVAVPTSTFVVQVGASRTRHAAPGGNYKLAHQAPGSLRPLDLTGDKRVTQADAQEVAVAWSDLRQFDSPCGNLPDPSRDVNQDGCVDVADAQIISSNSTPAPRLAVSAAAALTFTVNTTGDAGDANIGNGICATAAGVCSLRAAIQEANAHPGPDTINFNIPGAGVKTIQLGFALPTISDTTGPLTIDGYTQPGSSPNTAPLVDNAVIQIEIKGGGPGTGNGTTGYDGIVISSGSNVIRGLALYNLRRAFLVTGDSADNNVIVGNFIGTNAAGTFGLPSFIVFASGVYIQNGAGNTQVGTTATADRNVISGNAANGIATYYEASDNGVFFNNIIGLNPSGTAALPNRNMGIDINSQSSFNIIGGTGPGQRNVISGNSGAGVEISHDTLTSGNKVIGNYIGTDVNGNGGGDPTQCATYFTSNQQWGVHVEDGVNNNLIANNVIGNSKWGGYKSEGYDTVSTQLTNNRIGIGVNGNPIPNCAYGVQVAFHSSYMKIGPGNIIANNQEGIQVTTADADFNTITQNSIYNNTNYQNQTSGNGRGIDLDPLDPVNPNLNDAGDADSGANQQLNFPVITTATPFEVGGTACADAGVPKPCMVEIYIADRGAGGYGQGKTLVGAGPTQSNGSFLIPVNGVSLGNYVTATATDATGNTSEFGANVQVNSNSGPPTPTPTPSPTPSSTVTYAADSFNRQISGGWGAADIGGGYALENPGRQNYAPASDYNVTGGAGTMTTQSGKGGTWHSAYLPTVSAQNVDITFRVKTDVTDPTGFQFVYFSARRVGAGTQYLGRVGFDPSGGVLLQAAKSISENITLLGNQVGVAGLSHTAGSYIWVHGQLTGTNPTTIRMRAWANGQAEPTTWQYTVTDSEPQLQAAGAVGLRTFVSSGASNLPVVFSFDDFFVEGPASDSLVTPTETQVPTNVPTDTPTDTPSPSATLTPTDTPLPTQTPLPTDTLTPTDTPLPTVTPTATSISLNLAADSYSRTVSNGWGTADLGGAYTLGGTAADFAVNGAEGTMNLSVPNALRSAYLMSVSAQDVELSFRFKTNKVASDGGQIVYAIARRQPNGNDYLARVRLPTDGTLRVQAVKEVGGVATLLGAEGLVSGLTQAANTYYQVRVQVSGTNPTTIRMRVWLDGSSEPTAWQYSTTDSAASLQAAGGVGLRSYVSSAATYPPVLLSFDDLAVTNPIAPLTKVKFVRANNATEPRREVFPEGTKRFPKH